MTNIALGSIHTYAALRAPSCRSDSCYSCDSVNGPLKPRPHCRLFRRQVVPRVKKIGRC